MEQEQEQQLYRMQADLCQTLADPTRLEMLSLLGEGPRAVKDLVALLGIVGNENLNAVADEAKQRLQRVVVALSCFGNDGIDTPFL